MKTIPPWAGVAARVVLGAVFSASGVMKAAAPAEEFAVVIAAYGILPVAAVMSAATFLPWLELLAGFCLLFGYLTRAAAAAAGGMLMAFIFALLSTKLRGFELPNCGCFGHGIHLTQLQAAGLDCLLLVLAFLARLAGAGKPSLDAWAESGQ